MRGISYLGELSLSINKQDHLNTVNLKIGSMEPFAILYNITSATWSKGILPELFWFSLCIRRGSAHGDSLTKMIVVLPPAPLTVQRATTEKGKTSH